METRKTNRKNNTNQTITWPTTGGHFAIKDLFTLNPTMKEITLRTKLNEAIAENLVSAIGTKKNDFGRPTKILAMTPITQELLNNAYANGISKLEDTKTSLITNTVATTPISTTNNQSVAIPTTHETVSPVVVTTEKNIVNV